MTPRQEAALFVAAAICIGAHLMLEKARNLVRDVADDYPLWSVAATLISGVVIGGWLVYRVMA